MLDELIVELFVDGFLGGGKGIFAGERPCPAVEFHLRSVWYVAGLVLEFFREINE